MANTEFLEINSSGWTALPEGVTGCAFEFQGSGFAKYRESVEDPSGDWGHMLTQGDLKSFEADEALGSRVWFRVPHGAGRIVYTSF